MVLQTMRANNGSGQAGGFPPLLRQALDLPTRRPTFLDLVGVAVDDLPFTTLAPEDLGDAERVWRWGCAED